MKPLGMLLLSLTLTATAQDVPQELYWTMSWDTSPQKPVPASVPPEPVFENTTIPQIVHLSTGGKYVRMDPRS